jgi:adenylate cyclase
MFLDAGFSEERIIEITRVLGEGMGRLATTIIAAFAQTFLQKGDNEEDVALRFADLAEQLTPATGPILVAAFNAHLREAVSRAMLGQAELESGDAVGSQELAVCFADLVGFTRLGNEVEALELGTVAGRLAELAASITEGPVRLIKTIGDAAMFVWAARRRRAEPRRSLRARGAAQPARRHRLWPGAGARRRLLRALGQPGQPRDRRRPPGKRAVHRGGA